jgi:hypothetical protein
MSSQQDWNRRDFGRLVAAAVGGLAAGSLTGCPSSAPPPSPVPAGPSTGGAPGTQTGGTAGPQNLLLGAEHACRGLNSCMGLDKEGDNACAGQGDCATIAAHSCHASNECKGQGGCGAAPAQNACQGQGGCAVPLHAGAWEKARAAFEERMQADGKEVGAAPAG